MGGIRTPRMILIFLKSIFYWYCIHQKCTYRVYPQWMKSSQVWMRSSQVWMRSSRVVRSSGCQCQSRNSPGLDHSILRNCGIWGAADEAVLKRTWKKNSPFIYVHFLIYSSSYSYILSCFRWEAEDGGGNDERHAGDSNPGRHVPTDPPQLQGSIIIFCIHNFYS